jgi:hypothetical protein
METPPLDPTQVPVSTAALATEGGDRTVLCFDSALLPR